MIWAVSVKADMQPSKLTLLSIDLIQTAEPRISCMNGIITLECTSSEAEIRASWNHPPDTDDAFSDEVYYSGDKSVSTIIFRIFP